MTAVSDASLTPNMNSTRPSKNMDLTALEQTASAVNYTRPASAAGVNVTSGGTSTSTAGTPSATGTNTTTTKPAARLLSRPCHPEPGASPVRNLLLSVRPRYLASVPRTVTSPNPCGDSLPRLSLRAESECSFWTDASCGTFDLPAQLNFTFRVRLHQAGPGVQEGKCRHLSFSGHRASVKTVCHNTVLTSHSFNASLSPAVCSPAVILPAPQAGLSGFPVQG